MKVSLIVINSVAALLLSACGFMTDPRDAVDERWVYIERLKIRSIDFDHVTPILKECRALTDRLPSDKQADGYLFCLKAKAAENRDKLVDKLAPIKIDPRVAVDERWAMVFSSERSSSDTLISDIHFTCRDWTNHLVGQSQLRVYFSCFKKEVAEHDGQLIDLKDPAAVEKKFK